MGEWVEGWVGGWVNVHLVYCWGRRGRDRWGIIKENIHPSRTGKDKQKKHHRARGKPTHLSPVPIGGFGCCVSFGVVVVVVVVVVVR